MLFRFRFSVILCFCLFILVNFRCEKDFDPTPFQYEFEIPVSLSPVKKSYSLNDTIWLETEVNGKFLHDTKTNQDIMVDTAMLYFVASYYGFGVNLKNPPNGFCEIIPSNGLSVNKENSDWNTLATIQPWGCGLNSYRFKLGFKPNHKGTYTLLLPQDYTLGSCSNKIKQYNASTSYRFNTNNLNLDVFNNFANNNQLSAEQKTYFTNKINKREMFVFQVE